jgi:hypothetical protein
MPNPKKYDNQKDWMSACVPMRVEEGDEQKQAVAVCLSMWRERNKEMEEQKAMDLWNFVKGLFVKEEPQFPRPHPFTIWKDTETGQYRWLAIYSNKWRDDDNPPEILASTAHKEFVDAVDSGDWNMPEAWLWHVPGTKFGVADYVAYDENGFALASGTVDKGMEHVAESLATDDDLAMSHGMPVKEIERDTEDPTIITRYRTLEISPLPRESAANKHGTAIQILQEVKQMAIPENKKPFLKDKMGEEGLATLEAHLEDKAKELEDMEIESKEEEELEAEVEQEAAPEQEPEEIGDEEGAEPKEETVEEDPPEYVTGPEVAEAVGAYLKPLMEQLSALTEAVESQGKELKALQKSEEEKIKETVANTPAASLFEQIGSVIGSKETYVDGRTTLGKAGPKETQDDSNSPTPVPILNELMGRSWGQ